ncbi:hypothetical protein B484DRAFT_224454 [Ochromonadaceae sp. CCMP2298]|nr:hypothetical protein B484DRAFT_224454 [Ochromonadaceae sp. CCMP2298]
MEGRLAWSVAAERKCGRPLGLRVRQEGRTKYLYIMDAYHGLFKLNLADSSVQHLVTPESAIKTPKGSDAAASKPAKFFNDLDVTADGRVLFTDSSYKHTRSENRQEVLDGAPRGRLLQFDPAPGQGLKTLVCGLHFPNGVQLLSQREVLVVELGRFRVLKVHLERVGEGALASCGERGTLAQALGEEADTRYGHWGIDYFSKNIPGLGDNVRLDAGAGAGGNHYLVGCGSKSAQPFSLLWLAYQHGWLRDALGKLLPMQLVEKLVPKYGLVLVLDQAGKTVASLHDATGRVALLSQAQRHPVTGDLWLGSHSESLAILHAEHVPRTWA